MRGLKLRLLLMGLILMVLSLALYFARGMNHELFALTAVGAALFVAGILTRE